MGIYSSLRARFLWLPGSMAGTWALRKCVIYQWRIQDFPRGGAWTSDRRFSAKMNAKTKELGSVGGCAPGTPPRSANVYCCILTATHKYNSTTQFSDAPGQACQYEASLGYTRHIVVAPATHRHWNRVDIQSFDFTRNTLHWRI